MIYKHFSLTSDNEIATALVITFASFRILAGIGAIK